MKSEALDIFLDGVSPHLVFAYKSEFNYLFNDFGTLGFTVGINTGGIK